MSAVSTQREQDVQAQTDRERLVRIVSMLISLSCLADSASRCFWLIRCLLLRILRPAEAASLQFVAGLVQLPPHLALEFQIDLNGSRPADLLRLAARLRMLAAVLDAAIVSGGLDGAKIRWAVSIFIEKIAAAVESLPDLNAFLADSFGYGLPGYRTLALPAPDTS